MFKRTKLLKRVVCNKSWRLIVGAQANINILWDIVCSEFGQGTTSCSMMLNYGMDEAIEYMIFILLVLKSCLLLITEL